MQIVARVLTDSYGTDWKKSGFRPPISTVEKTLEKAVAALFLKTTWAREEILKLATLTRFDTLEFTAFMSQLGHPELAGGRPDQAETLLLDLLGTHLIYWSSQVDGYRVHPAVRELLTEHKRINLPNLHHDQVNTAVEVFDRLYRTRHHPYHLNELAYHLIELIGLGQMSETAAVNHLLQTAQVADIASLMQLINAPGSAPSEYVKNLLKISSGRTK